MGLVLVLLICTFTSLAWAEVIADVAFANVTITGGPKGQLELGKNFALHCNLVISYPNREAWGWKYVTTFYHNQWELGSFKSKFLLVVNIVNTRI